MGLGLGSGLGLANPNQHPAAHHAQAHAGAAAVSGGHSSCTAASKLTKLNSTAPPVPGSAAASVSRQPQERPRRADVCADAGLGGQREVVPRAVRQLRLQQALGRVRARGLRLGPLGRHIFS